MKVSSKFEIGDLTQRKYETEDRDHFVVHEIMGIVTDTCYIGTQVFYSCRAHVLKKIYGKEYMKTGNFTWCVYSGVGEGDNATGLKKWREDELIPMSKKWKEVLNKP